MTPATRAAIRARCAAATPGPWLVGDAHLHVHGQLCPQECHNLYAASTQGIVQVTVPYAGLSWADAAFLAYARGDVPLLLDEVARLTQENAALRQQIAGHGERTQREGRGMTPEERAQRLNDFLMTHVPCPPEWHMAWMLPHLQEAIQEAIAQERADCAHLAETQPFSAAQMDDGARGDIARAIRERSNP